MGRFLSPDWSAKEEPVPYAQMDDPQRLNLYAYVRNNPLSRVDADGHCWPVCTVALGAIAGGLAGAGAEALHEAFQGKGFDGGRIGHAAIGGAIAGAITGLAGPGAGVAVTAAIASAGSVIGGGVERQLAHEKVLDGKAIAIDAVAGAVGGAAGKKLDALIPSVAPGEELTKGAGNSFTWASRNGAEAATENVIRGAVRTGANTAVGTGLNAASNAAKDATQTPTPKPAPPPPPKKQN